LTSASIRLVFSPVKKNREGKREEKKMKNAGIKKKIDGHERRFCAANQTAINLMQV
jgi:hypothetical protein